MIKNLPQTNTPLEKVSSGIAGLDEITLGGLPKGRSTLLVGNAGTGKTLFGMGFICRAAMQGEHGIFVAFEEKREDLHTNVASFGLSSREMEKQGKIAILEMHIEPGELNVSGNFDLSGLFVRLEHTIQTVGAQRVVLDSIDVLFAALPEPISLRNEMSRLLRWLREHGLTTLLTAERPDATRLTRHGLEEFVSDCVIALDHRIKNGISTRRLRVVKYRGSLHGTNEYPFMIGDAGIEVVPATSMGLHYEASKTRLSSGIPGLDDMLGGGFYKGSSVLISGTAGTGKTTISSHVAAAAARAGKRCLYLLFEESPAQLKRNMASVGLDLAHGEEAGYLRMAAMRPQTYGLEQHLVQIMRLIKEWQPDVLVVDPLTAWLRAGHEDDATGALIRLVDFVKNQGITAIMTSLQSQQDVTQVASGMDVSSLIDTWLMLLSLEGNGERNHGLYIIKSRGMAHSNQIREYLITQQGIQLSVPYIGPAGVLTGSARLAQESREAMESALRQDELLRLQEELARQESLLANEIEMLKKKMEREKASLTARLRAAMLEEELRHEAQTAMGKHRRT